MISRDEGEGLIRILAKKKTPRALRGAMVAMNCHGNSTTLGSENLCEAATAAERRLIEEHVVGGFLRADGEELSIAWEYLLADFGIGPDPSERSRVSIANPKDACTKVRNAGRVKGRMLVVPRGGCQFWEKVVNGARAGATAILIANNAPGLTRVGVEPKWKALNVTIPVGMVSTSGGEWLEGLAGGKEG